MRNNKGFSLIELIIVIAIMAVLVGVIAPVYVKYVESGKESADIANMDNAYRVAYAVRCEEAYDTVLYYYTSETLGTEAPDAAYGVGRGIYGGKTYSNPCCDEGIYDSSQSYEGKIIKIILPEPGSVDLDIHVHWVDK